MESFSQVLIAAVLPKLTDIRTIGRRHPVDLATLLLLLRGYHGTLPRRGRSVPLFDFEPGQNAVNKANRILLFSKHVTELLKRRTY